MEIKINWSLASLYLFPHFFKNSILSITDSSINGAGSTVYRFMIPPGYSGYFSIHDCCRGKYPEGLAWSTSGYKHSLWTTSWGVQMWSRNSPAPACEAVNCSEPWVSGLWNGSSNNKYIEQGLLVCVNHLGSCSEMLILIQTFWWGAGKTLQFSQAPRWCRCVALRNTALGCLGLCRVLVTESLANQWMSQSFSSLLLPSCDSERRWEARYLVICYPALFSWCLLGRMA